MTTMILINAALGAVALTVIVSLVAWAIKTQQRDAPVIAAAGRTRREVSSRRRPATQRQVARPFA